MIVGVLKEIIDGENRVAVTPQTVKDLLKSNLEVHIQSGAGELSFISDADYESSGAKIVPDAASILSKSDLVIKVATATLDEVSQFKNNSSYISLIQTTRDIEVVKKLTEKNISAFSMHS